jgi:hypothetical protein
MTTMLCIEDDLCTHCKLNAWHQDMFDILHNLYDCARIKCRTAHSCWIFLIHFEIKYQALTTLMHSVLCDLQRTLVKDYLELLNTADK